MYLFAILLLYMMGPSALVWVVVLFFGYQYVQKNGGFEQVRRYL